MERPHAAECGHPRAAGGRETGRTHHREESQQKSLLRKLPENNQRSAEGESTVHSTSEGLILY